MKKVMVAIAAMFAFVGTGLADGRMVAVKSFDRSTGEVTLSISAGSGADVDKALIAAWAPGDAGEDAAKWRKFASVGVVQDATTSVSFTVPSDWRSVSGAVRFFLMEKTAPYARRFECITGNPGPWIDTGIVPDVETDASVTACYKMDMAPFGLSTVFYLFSNTLDTNAKAGYYVGFFGTNPSIESAPRGSAFRELRLNKTGAYIDGDRYSTFDPTNHSGTAKYSMALFGRRDNGSGSIGKQQGSCSIAAARILTNGVPARVYVPCQTSGGIVTLYDRVTGTFCDVKGDGSFTAGTEICPAPEDCGAVESATAATLFAPTLTPGEKDVAAGTVIVSIGGGHDEGFVLAVADTEDKGTVLSAWSKGMCVAKVPAVTDSVAATLPADWWRDGLVVRFFWMSATDHPYDYEAEYLHTAGSAYANTGWIPTMETAFEVSAKGPADVCAFGLTENFYLFSNGGNFYYWGFFGESGNGHAGPQVGTDFITLRLAKNVATVNGISVPKASGEFNYKVMTKGNPTPFRCSYNGDSLTKTGECWIKYAKTWENGDLVRDLVPCVTNGIAVFYDRVHGTFYGSVVSTKFEAGPAVIPADTGNGDALAWSAAEPLALEEAIWDGGGGTDTDLRTAGNWTSDKAPDLDNATVVPTFATGGTRASLGAPASVLGLKFALKNGFTVSGNSPNALSVGHGGITVEDDPSERLSTWRYANIACPIVVAEDQTWNLSTNGNRRLQLTADANVTGAAGRTVTVDGNGCLGLAGANDFRGDFQLNGGTVKVLSRHKAFGSAEDGGKVYVNLLTKKLTCEFFGVVIDKPMFVTGGNDSVENFVFRAYNGENCLVAAPLTLQTGGRLMAHVQDDTVCEGGMTLNADLVLQGSGKKLTFRGEPVSSSGKQIETWGVTDFHFYVPSNKVNFLIGPDGGTSCIHFWTNNVFHDYSSHIRMNSSTKMDLHGFSQNFARIEMDGANNVIHSDAPANCFGYYNVGNVPDTVLKGKFTGKVNFVKSGGDKVTLDAKSTSLGILRAQNGPLVVSACASWAGTDVQVGTRETNRKPTLFLTHGDSFDSPQKTKLTLTTSQAGTIYTADVIPVVNIAEGVTQKVKELWLDGTRLAGGTWGSSESPAENKDDVHFAGKGVLDVRGWGCVIIVQ